MSKGAAAYEQGRLARMADHGPRNEHMDGSAFKDTEELERDRLVSEKKILEGEIGELKARIARAKSHAWHRGSYTHPNAWHRWDVERAAKAKRAAEIDAALASGRQERRRLDMRQVPGLFAECFVAAAKEMLAEPVYDRLRIAALHRLSERPTTPTDEEAK